MQSFCDVNLTMLQFVHIHREVRMQSVPRQPICGLFIYFTSPLHLLFVEREQKQYSIALFSIYFQVLGKRGSAMRGALSFEFSAWIAIHLSHLYLPPARAVVYLCLLCLVLASTISASQYLNHSRHSYQFLHGFEGDPLEGSV